MKTAMQQHISDLETMLEDEYYEIAKQAITNCLICANSYLETEKNQIINTYQDASDNYGGSKADDYYKKHSKKNNPKTAFQLK